MGDDGSDRRREAETVGRLARSVRRADEADRLLTVARLARRFLPGDPELGDDPLSTGGDDPSHLIARRVSQAAAERPSVARELGLGAVQVWQALSEASGRGRGSQEVTIVFTDLVEFSSWALSAGDDAVLSLLRDVARTVEPAMEARGGRIVKRLGDGLMAVFDDPAAGVAAAREACASVAQLEFDGHRPALRAGVHTGRPRRLGGDYLGVDVNVAARVTDAAGDGEVLVSDEVRRRVDPAQFSFRRKRRFRAKGAPKDLAVYAAEPA